MRLFFRSSFWGYCHVISIGTVAREPCRVRWNGTGTWVRPRIFFQRSAWSTLIHSEAVDLKNVFPVLKMAWGGEDRLGHSEERESCWNGRGFPVVSGSRTVGMWHAEIFPLQNLQGLLQRPYSLLGIFWSPGFGGFISPLKMGSRHGLFNLETRFMSLWTSYMQLEMYDGLVWNPW